MEKTNRLDMITHTFLNIVQAVVYVGLAIAVIYAGPFMLEVMK